MSFDTAFTALIALEGGYTAGVGDPGGETKYGVSRRSYPTLDIKNLTLEQAKAIYLRDFWLPAGCDKVPEGVAFDLFDTAVNSGVSRAVKMLQTAVGVAADGQLGPATLAAINRANGASLRGRFNGARLQFMTELPTWATFGKGWARRIASNLLRA